MDFQSLSCNLTGVAAEMCLKMGMTLPAISLNYPLATLNSLLGAQLSQPDMARTLKRFGRETADTLGGVTAAPVENGFCLTVPAQGVQYAMAHAPGLDFLKELVDAISRGCDLEALLAVFRRHSDHVHVEAVDSPEFDHLIYFENGEPDSFYYCVHAHGGHVEYHRFSKADYEAFGF